MIIDRSTDNPCIGYCTTTYDEICQGCGRSLEEVSSWMFLPVEKRVAIWLRIEQEASAKRFVDPSSIPQ